jgi:hypothetical protein
MRYCKLRIAWSVACFIACLLLLALWARSYWRCDEFSIDAATRLTRVTSNYGQLHFATEIYSGPGEIVEKWGVWSGEALPHVIIPPMPKYSALGFSVATTGVEGDGFAVTTPLWFPTLTFAALATVPSLRWRFSLSTLLIVTTVVAVVLGLGVYSIS